MSRILKISALALLALVCIVPAASARPFVVGGYWGGPGFYYGGYGPGWYAPGWYAPYGYGYYGAYGYRALTPTGSVKIDTKMKDAQVYVDGGFAGTVDQLKTFKLRTGDHNIEVRTANGTTIYQDKVDVIAGKTLKINPTGPSKS